VLKDFEDLEIWQLANQLRIEIYKLTQKYPRDGFFLKDQTNRAAHSSAANIAEGHGVYHYQQNIEHLRRARGSAEEVRDALIAAKGYGFIDQKIQESYDIRYRELIRQLNAYTSYLNKKKLF